MDDAILTELKERMAASVKANPLHPRSIIFTATLAGVPTSYVPAGCDAIGGMSNGIAVLLDDNNAGPDSFADQTGLQKLLAGAVHADTFCEHTTTEDAFRFVGKWDSGVLVVLAVTAAEQVENWDRFFRRFVPPRVMQ